MLYSSTILAVEGGKIADSLGFWSVFTLPAGIIFLLIGFGVLWDRKFRPSRINNGVPTASFANIMNRTLKFIFIEDKYPIYVKDQEGNPTDKMKYPKFGKWLVWRNLYIVLAAVSTVLTIVGNSGALLLWAFLLLVVFSRTSKVFAQRHSILMRMYEVAASELGYSNKDSINPWAYVSIKNWEQLTIPGETHVHFPARYKSEEQKNRENFERHFNGTVTDDNTWIYKWHSSKGMVSCAPVTKIPEYAPYPGSSKGEWDKIPLGLGTEGEVFWDVSKAPMSLITGTTGGGKSTIQRNIIFHCIQHSDRWRFLGIDVKRVELSPYVKYDPVVMGIATNVADGVEIIRYANEEMMNRYTEMEARGVNHFKDLPEVPYALMVLVDETYMFLAQSPAKSSDEVKEENELKGEASKAIGDIARLGRAAGVHLVLATQRPDATVIYGELKQNLACRIAAGKADTIASQMTLDNDNATRLPGNIKGRGYVQVFGEGEQFQGYYADQDWIDKFLAGEDPDGDGPAEPETPERTKERKRLSMKKEPQAPEIVSDFSDPIEDEPKPKSKKKGGLLGKLNSFNEAQIEKDGGKPSVSLEKESMESPESDDFNMDSVLKASPKSIKHEKQAELLRELKESPVEDDFVDPFGGFNTSSSHSVKVDDSIFGIPSEDNDEDEFDLFGGKNNTHNSDTLKGNEEDTFDLFSEDDIFTSNPEPAELPKKSAPALPNKPASRLPSKPSNSLPSSLPQRPSLPKRPSRPTV
ncbi:MAG: hypothetical protein H9W81_22010 [Enterococcus sp.]|nr:hypothetical protein [Enterococcus sp.]